MSRIKVIVSKKAKGCLYILSLFFFLNSLQAQNWQAIGYETPPFYSHEYKVLYSDTIDDYLYVGGTFYTIGGIETKGIARWDGVQWDSLHWGVDELMYPNSYFHSPVHSIARYDGEIFIGGTFRSLGNIYCRGLGRWNGSTWDCLPVPAFGSDQDINILALEVIDNKVFVGGIFDSIAGQPCRSLTVWDGNGWNLLGMPSFLAFNVTVSSICEYQGEVYIGGNFRSNLPSNEDTVKGIIRWDGTNWKSVGGGLRGLQAWVNDMVVYNDELYVAGYFYKSAGNISTCIQKWNGSEWLDVGGGLSGATSSTCQAWTMTVHNNKLYVTGAIESAGGIQASKIAVWNGVNWCSLGSTIDGLGRDVAFFQDTMYMVGGFWTIDGDSIYRIAKWLGGDYVDECAYVGIDSPEPLKFSVYPNPTSGMVTITSEYNLDEIMVSDATGKLVYLSKGNNGTKLLTLDLSALQSGIYFVTITSGMNRKTGKIIVTN